MLCAVERGGGGALVLAYVVGCTGAADVPVTGSDAAPPAVEIPSPDATLPEVDAGAVACRPLSAWRVDLAARCFHAFGVVAGVCAVEGLPSHPGAGIWEPCLVGPDGSLYVAWVGGTEEIKAPAGWTHSAYGLQLASTLSSADEARCSQAKAVLGAPPRDPPGTCGDGGADAAPCGDPVVMARFDSCVQAHDSPACAVAGGIWTSWWGNTWRCLCPTGEEGCACTSSAQCQIFCLADCPEAGYSCADVAGGRCPGTWPVAGTYCAEKDGVFGLISFE
jgi:hypothetical protein